MTCSLPDNTRSLPLVSPASVPPASVPGRSPAAEQRRFVTRLLLRLGVPAADVEDAAHDVFLLSCRRHLDLADGEDWHGWLCVTARYVGLNRRRAVRRESARRSFPQKELVLESEDRSLAPDDQLAARQLCRLLAEACERLSNEQQSAVRGLLEGGSAAEIALEQRTPVATIASRLRVSRLALRRHLHRRGWPVDPAQPAARRAA